MKRILHILLLHLLLAALCLASSPASAGGERTEGDGRVSQEGSSGSSVATWLISFYRDHISAVDSDRCPSLPTCGAYSAQAFRKHGFVMGWLMTVDRLIHEGREETKVSPLVYSEGSWKIYDPVENNDFWWYKRESKPDDD